MIESLCPSIGSCKVNVYKNVNSPSFEGQFDSTKHSLES